MNKLPILAIIAVFIAAMMPSCHSDKDDNWYDTYKEWREANEQWLKDQQSLTNPDGTPYYQTIVPQWNPAAYVLIHYYNDRALTAGNLQPMSTSTVDVRYIGHLYNNVPFDSSTTQTAYGPGIFRTQLNKVIEGWTIALETMHVGDTAEILIPYQCAYGVSSTGSIPPYSNLRFNVRLEDIYRYEISPK